jgi:uncharacterized protein (DUF2062 family)
MTVITATKKSMEEFDTFLDSKNGKIALAGGVTVGILAASATPSHASVADVEAMVTSLGGIAAAVTTVVVGAMGVRYAIKLVNRVAVKG